MGRTCRHWPMFERVLSHERLMDAMLRHAGAEAGIAVRDRQGAAWYEARTACLGCPETRRCQNWLDTADPLAPPPEFCRGAWLFSHRASIGSRSLNAVLSPEPVEGGEGRAAHSKPCFD